MNKFENSLSRLYRKLWPKPVWGNRRRADRRRLICEPLEERLVFMSMQLPTDHVHAMLSIVLEGTPVVIPANIGVTNDHSFNPHTEDATGKLHIGDGGPAGLGDVMRLVMLSDFFDVWREAGGLAGNNPNSRFDSTHILDRTADANHVVEMFVNGQKNEDFQNYKPMDMDQIVIRFGEPLTAPNWTVLSAASDTGISNSDHITRAETWQIQVGGVMEGAMVELRNGTTVLGQAVAAGTTVMIAADVSDLSDGPVNVTAVQTVDGVTSPASPVMNVMLDREVSQFSLEPRAALAGENYSFDLTAGEEGEAGFSYSRITGPTGATVAAGTGLITWSPTAAQIGRHTLTVRATDPAGNTRDLTAGLFAVDPAFPWQNPANPLDVTGDNLVASLDALVMINRINSSSSRTLAAPTASDASPPFYDPTRDNMLTALDVIQVVNFLNGEPTGGAAGEGENAAGGESATTVSSGSAPFSPLAATITTDAISPASVADALVAASPSILAGSARSQPSVARSSDSAETTSSKRPLVRIAVPRATLETQSTLWADEWDEILDQLAAAQSLSPA